MDFSFEKTNSAYMLFYERCPKINSNSPDSGDCASTTLDNQDSITSFPQSPASPLSNVAFELSKELEDWIWQDNMHFIQDKNIFEHTYFKYAFFAFLYTFLYSYL